MNTSHLLTTMHEAQLSPEEFGKRMGISGMTIRRWQRQPSQPLSAVHQTAFVDAVYRLVSKGLVAADSRTVKELIRQGHYIPAHLAVRYLGCEEEVVREADRDPRRLIECLSKIGTAESRRGQVDRHQKTIESFKRMSKEWSYRITTLLDIIRSDRHAFQKLVAYGALFYLLTPFDLIPDHIPVFGLLDDFVILGAAVAFYARDSKSTTA